MAAQEQQRQAEKPPPRGLAALALASILGLAAMVSSFPLVDLGTDPLERVWQGNFSARALSGRSWKLVDWNIERGVHLGGIAALLEREKPDIYVLQEVDLNTRRTGAQNIAEELARRFRLNYAFAVEFEELGQRSAAQPAYQGQAILAAFPIRSPRVLRFAHQSDFWRPRRYLPDWPLLQRRLGGRMALVAELDLGSVTAVLYNAHLESHGSERLRLLQLREILADASDHPAGVPIIVAGDLNTESSHSPLILELRQSGFRNALDGPLRVTRPGRGAKDWIFVRGPLRFWGGAVYQDTNASDHYPLSVYLSPTGG